MEAVLRSKSRLLGVCGDGASLELMISMNNNRGTHWRQDVASTQQGESRFDSSRFLLVCAYDDYCGFETGSF